MAVEHISVLVEEIVANLVVAENSLIVDATLGGGGHAFAILNRFEGISLIGMDADEEALERAEKRLHMFGDRVSLMKGNFGNLKNNLSALGFTAVDGIIFDLGFSTYQMMGNRGFSFSDDGALDMRMDRSQSLTAYDVVNAYGFEDLKRVIGDFGEESRATQIARAILEARKKRPVDSGRELAGVVETVKRRTGKIHPATKVFQALRMEVNDELGNLQRGLSEAIEILRPSGRALVISFHSLEDRVVKTMFRQSPDVTVVHKKAIRPSRDEVRRNPRARSAKLRVAEKI